MDQICDPFVELHRNAVYSQSKETQDMLNSLNRDNIEVEVIEPSAQIKVEVDRRSKSCLRNGYRSSCI